MENPVSEIRSRDPRLVGAWIVGITSLVVYTITIAPTVAFWDVGEFIATAFTMGVPHPPGAPTFVLLGRLFTMVPTPFGVAAEVNFLSVVSSAATVLLLYGIILEVLHLWEEGHEDSRGYSPLVQVVAACTGALAYAFSHSAWFNSVEAEVYSLSMAVTALCLWLALRHVHGRGDRKRASLLLLIGYILGIGAGNHLLALLTIPSILILLWYFDRDVLKRVDLWMGVVVLFMVGYTIYALIYIRSGLNPPIDMNNPENWLNFTQFLQRRQYGSESMLFSIFNRNADFWSYQLNYHFLRYYRSEFFIPFYFLAIFGALLNLQRDRKTFLANAALWTIMGLGLVVYLNMPNPQPRDRDYIFVGCYFVTAIWIGTGMAGLAGFVREFLLRSPAEDSGGVTRGKDLTSAIRTAAIAAGVVGVILVGTQFVLNFHSHDRSRDHISWDYGYNILQSCPPNSILFTNGDNDTYPLWYLQIVEGIRQDIRVVNLSLLNTPWYIKELRDREPKVPIRLTDQYLVNQMGLAMFQQDTTFAIAGVDWTVPGNVPIRVQDQMVVHIIQANDWKQPVYFAITVPQENQAWFVDYLQLEGFAFRVLPESQRVELETCLHNLRDVFQYRGITDRRIYKDENATTLLHNYRVVFQETADTMLQQGDVNGAYELLEWGSEVVDLSAPDYHAYRAMVTMVRGDTLRAIQMFEEALVESFVLPVNRIRAYSSLIYSYSRSGMRTEAAVTLERWFRELAGSSEPVGDPPLSELSLELLLNTIPADYAFVQSMLILMHQFADAGEFDRATWVVEKWLQRSPGDVEARIWLEELRQGRMPEDLPEMALRFVW